MNCKKLYYKYCLVPHCPNTTANNPQKIYFTLPTKNPRREKWLKAMRRKQLSQYTIKFVCEDHFNLEEDLENYIKFKYYGGQYKLKPEVVPHVFHCQSKRNTVQSSVRCSTSSKQSRKALVQVICDENAPEQDELEGSHDKGRVTPTPVTPQKLEAAVSLCLLSGVPEIQNTMQKCCEIGISENIKSQRTVSNIASALKL